MKVYAIEWQWIESGGLEYGDVYVDRAVAQAEADRLMKADLYGPSYKVVELELNEQRMPAQVSA